MSPFAAPLLRGRLLRRYKRFLADVDLDDGPRVVAHVANTGAMLGLAEPGARVWLSPSADPRRALGYTWELVEADFGAGPELVGIHTGRPNALVAGAIAAGLVPTLAGYRRLRREVRYGTNSRVDLLLEDDGRPPCYVEVKNVHLMRTPGLAEFPDCVTARGSKHLAELAATAAAGARAVLVFLVQIGSARQVALARDLDPAYGAAFDRAAAAGVEAIGLGCRISLDGIAVVGELPVRDLAGARS